MSDRRVIVAGAGLAGLSAAVAAVEHGIDASLSDSAAHAGGRCRSYYDPALRMEIDNGNHLVLSGNAAVARFRTTVEAFEPLAGPAHAEFSFVDLTEDTHWTVCIDDGRIPWWILSASKRVPGTSPADYIPLARLLRGGNRRIDSIVSTQGPLWERLLGPVLLAALNTPPAEASAALSGRVLRETLGKGGAAMCPRIALPTLGSAFIEPALSWLAKRGVATNFGRRLRALEFEGDRVSSLVWSDGTEAVRPEDAVILAVPPWVATGLVPGLIAPTEHHAIVNGHFAWPMPASSPTMLGVLGGTAEWIFVHDNRISVTVSAADALVDRAREELAATFWGDICKALKIDAPLPAWQIVKEKRATFSATPDQDALRPEAKTRWRNLFLAGDWVQNGLPATIEGALRSGDNAARLALGVPLRYAA